MTKSAGFIPLRIFCAELSATDPMAKIGLNLTRTETMHLQTWSNIVWIIGSTKTQRAAMGGDFSLSQKCFSGNCSLFRESCATSLAERVSI